MIQIEHLSVAYQQTLALEDLSLTIQGPTILGILGPNGAGKSTLITKNFQSLNPLLMINSVK